MREHRKTPRYQFVVTGTLHPAGGRVGANVMVRNISTLGCKLEHAEGPSIGENCELYFNWRGTHVGLEAQVVWKDAQGRMGLEFLAPDKDSQRRLKELCAALRTQPLAAPRLKEADAADSVLDSAKAQRAARSTAPLEAASSPQLKPVSERRHRQLPRYVSELPARLSNPATGATTDVTLVDLSISGGRLEGPELPDAGQTCELHTEWEGRRLVLCGAVVWKGKEQVGVKFSSLDEETEKLLRRICTNLRLEPPSPLPP
jgi:hypothetical protein